MAITPYLAMTAAEIRSCTSPPPKLAWMACHFSPYSTGLSGLPRELPEGSLLILNDRTPIRGHDPHEILSALQEAVEKHRCAGVLLDFETWNSPDLARLSAVLMEELSCPRAVSAAYARETDPVFLPAVPEDVPAEAWLAPWKGRCIWLECSCRGKSILLTKEGSLQHPCTDPPPDIPGTADPALHCRCSITQQPNGLLFRLSRTQEDLLALLEEAEAYGVQEAVGLYQELGNMT